jgi:ribosome biogenesis GTPase A
MDSSESTPRSGNTAPPPQEIGRESLASRHASPTTRHPYVILTGNPNSGKTTLFNALTGLRAKVGT